jgi:hypothetical protein
VSVTLSRCRSIGRTGQGYFPVTPLSSHCYGVVEGYVARPPRCVLPASDESDGRERREVRPWPAPFLLVLAFLYRTFLFSSRFTCNIYLTNNIVVRYIYIYIYNLDPFSFRCSQNEIDVCICMCVCVYVKPTTLYTNLHTARHTHTESSSSHISPALPLLRDGPPPPFGSVCWRSATVAGTYDDDNDAPEEEEDSSGILQWWLDTM